MSAHTAVLVLSPTRFCTCLYLYHSALLSHLSQLLTLPLLISLCVLWHLLIYFDLLNPCFQTAAPSTFMAWLIVLKKIVTLLCIIVLNHENVPKAYSILLHSRSGGLSTFHFLPLLWSRLCLPLTSLVGQILFFLFKQFSGYLQDNPISMASSSVFLNGMLYYQFFLP